MQNIAPQLLLSLLVCLSFAHGKQPNILFCISDDQSYAHTGANGDPVVKTPAFDRVAREGIRFTRTFCDAPTCGPSRSAILTGQSIWRLEEAGNLWSTLPKKFITYPEVLAEAGYSVGFTGKAWSPGRLSAGGRDANPAGMEFQERKLKPSFKWMRNTDYAANFDDFLGQVKEDQPFCFWLGTSEPHRGYELGAGKRTGKDLSKVIVPGIFPDNSIVRNDILDYYVEVEHFDKMVARAIRSLEKLGQLDNTIVVVTSDHGMPFPRAKASLYDAGTHVPLAIRWPKGIRKPGRVSHALVNLSDLAPTFLEAADISIPKMMIGKALTDIFKDKTKVKREAAFIAMERHAGCREGGKGYPCRAIRTKEYLYIRNFDPDRWPAGSPERKHCVRHIRYGEVDPSPTKTVMMDDSKYAKLADLAFGKRPAEELYLISDDPYQLRNLADAKEFQKTRDLLRQQLDDHLKKSGDPRLTGKPALWDYYPFYRAPKFPGWKVAPMPAEFQKVHKVK